MTTTLTDNEQKVVDVLKRGGRIENHAGVVTLYDEHGYMTTEARFTWTQFKNMDTKGVIRKTKHHRTFESTWGLAEAWK